MMNSSALSLQQIPDQSYSQNHFMYLEDTPPLHGGEMAAPLCNYDNSEWWPVLPWQSSSNQAPCLELPSFDAICDDFTMWDPSVPQPLEPYEVNDNDVVDVKPLVSVPAEAAFDHHRIEQTPAEEEKEMFHQGGGGLIKPYGNKSSALLYDEIRKYFDVPISTAAKELKVGVTVLKKRCRELNIRRWPHRKIKSLTFLIQNAKDLGMTSEVAMLEEHKRMIHRIPEMELTEKTKKLRQACFKANYKKRRALGRAAAN